LLVLAGTSLRAQAPSALSLGDAARLAAKQNGAVEVARTRVSAADAKALEKRGALFPEINAGLQQAGRTINTATFGFEFKGPDGKPLLNPNGELLGPVPTVDMRVRITQPLLDLGAIAKWRSAQSSSLAASAEVNAQAEGAAAMAAAAYVRAARADAQLAARVADSVLAADLLRIARDQLQAGVGIALDVTRAQSQLSSTRAQLIAARNDRDRTKLELKRVLNMSLDAPLTLTDSLAGLPVDALVPDEAAALSRAFSTRPDVRSLQAQQTASEKALSAIRWERTPQIGLVYDQGEIGKNYLHLLPTYTWGVQLAVGLFDGNRRESRVQQQIAASREIDVRLNDLRSQSALDVRAALLDLSAAREQVDAARERLGLAEQEVSQARERFRAGVAGNADVISALLSLNQARTLRIDALAAFQSARVSLARATGAVQQLP
jgi:outer membrane protein TolC